MILAYFLVASICLRGQIIEIDHFNDSLYNFVGRSGDGNIFPVSEDRSILNVEFAQLVLFDNHTGEIIKFFNESTLEAKIDAYLNRRFGDALQRFTDEERKYLPYCRSNQFQYQRFYRIGSRLACQIDTAIKVKKLNDSRVHNFVVFFDKDLNVQDVYLRESRENPSLFSMTEGFFMDEKNYFVGKNSHTVVDTPNFVHFVLKDDVYKISGELEYIPETERLNYFAGRHLTSLKIGGKSYIHNGKTIYELSNDLQNCFSQIRFDLKENEFIADLKPLDNSAFLGIHVTVHPDGAAKSSQVYLFITNTNFHKRKVLKRYNILDFKLNSLETLDNKGYIHLYDAKKKKHLLQKIDPLL